MAKRELIEPKPGDKRYVRRDEKGHFTEQDDIGNRLPRIVANTQSTKRRVDRATEAIGSRPPKYSSCTSITMSAVFIDPSSQPDEALARPLRQRW